MALLANLEGLKSDNKEKLVETVATLSRLQEQLASLSASNQALNDHYAQAQNKIFSLEEALQNTNTEK